MATQTKSKTNLTPQQVDTLIALAGATKKTEFVFTGDIRDFLVADPFVTVDALGKRLGRLYEAGYLVRKAYQPNGSYLWRLSAKGKKQVS